MVKKPKGKPVKGNLSYMKTICLATSYYNAQEEPRVKDLGQFPEDKVLKKVYERLDEMGDSLGEIVHSYNIQIAGGIIHSEDYWRGKFRETLLFECSFAKEAPKLLKLVNEIAGIINFEEPDTLKKTTNKSKRKTVNPTFANVFYNLSSDYQYEFDTTSQEMLLVEIDKTSATTGTTQDDKMALYIGVEAPISFEALVEEIIHAKLPKDLQTMHERTARIRSAVIKGLVKAGRDKALQDPVIKKERESIFTVFRSFENDLEEVLKPHIPVARIKM